MNMRLSKWLTPEMLQQRIVCRAVSVYREVWAKVVPISVQPVHSLNVFVLLLATPYLTVRSVLPNRYSVKCWTKRKIKIGKFYNSKCKTQWKMIDAVGNRKLGKKITPFDSLPNREWYRCYHLVGLQLVWFLCNWF